MSSLSQLIGTWTTDESDDDSHVEFGRATLDFRPDGTLVYTIHSDDRDEKMLLTFDVQGNVLITDQPSRPHKERTSFSFTPDGKLILRYEDHEVRYVRATPEYS
jgi:hypothetical protein